MTKEDEALLLHVYKLGRVDHTAIVYQSLFAAGLVQLAGTDITCTDAGNTAALALLRTHGKPTAKKLGSPKYAAPPTPEPPKEDPPDESKPAPVEPAASRRVQHRSPPPRHR